MTALLDVVCCHLNTSLVSWKHILSGNIVLLRIFSIDLSEHIERGDGVAMDVSRSRFPPISDD